MSVGLPNSPSLAGNGRAGARIASPAFEGVHDSSFFTDNICSSAPPQVELYREVRAQDVLPQETMLVGLLNCAFHAARARGSTRREYK